MGVYGGFSRFSVVGVKRRSQARNAKCFRGEIGGVGLELCIAYA